MGKGAKALAVIVGFAVLAAAGVKAFQKPISYMLIARMLDQRMGRDVIGSLPDGLHVGLCGASGPLMNQGRGSGCAFVIAGKNFYVIDAGSGAAGNIGGMGLPAGQIKSIFLTHFHSDHIDGLGELLMNRWVQGRNTTPVPINGPVGVTRVVEGLREAYALDALYRTAHHGADLVPPSGNGGFAIPFDLGDDPMAFKVILEADGLKVTAFNVNHAPIAPAVGYKFEYGGRSVVISGDTSPSASVTAQASGVDVLVHEALQNTVIKMFEAAAREQGMEGGARIMHDILDYHTSPEQAAEIADKAGADYLLLYHIVPSLPSFMEKAFLGDAGDYYDGPIKIGTDGFMLSLPSGTDEIIEREML